MPVRATHVDPASMPAAGFSTKSAAHGHGKACARPVPHPTSSPSRRKAVDGPKRESLVSVLRPTASSSAKSVGYDDGVGTAAKSRRPILKRTAGAPASLAHLKGASLLSPRSPRVATRFARNRQAAFTNANREKLLLARGMNESPSPRPAPANQPRRAAPFATDAIPASVKQVPSTFEPKRVRKPVTADDHQLLRTQRRKFCKPVTPRLFRSHTGKAHVTGGQEHGNVVAPRPASPLAPKACESSRHVATDARVDHEAVAFGKQGHSAQLQRSFSRHVSAPVPQPDRARGLRHLKPSNPTERTMAAGAQGKSRVGASCPFDRSYERSPFAPPTARGAGRDPRKQWTPSVSRAPPSERPF